MSSLLTEAERLYRKSFAVYSDEPEIILGFAEKHGNISLIKQDGATAGMICTADIRDGDFSAQYIFAACISPEYRGKGLFRKHLNELCESKPTILIPENEDLFSMYEHLGFVDVVCLEADIDGENTAEDFDGTFDELYEIYKSSFQFPKKDSSLFKAAIKAHLAYGGEIKRQGASAILVFNGNAVDIFSPTADLAVSSAKSLIGRYKAVFPLECANALNDAGIAFSEKKIAMAKNILNTNIYINTLFN